MRLVPVGLLAAIGILSWGAPGAEAACRATPDRLGGARLRCDDGSTGRLRPDGTGNLRGRIGDRSVRVPSDAGSISPTQSLPATGGGSSGRGSRQGSNGRAANPCMSGGVLRTDCN